MKTIFHNPAKTALKLFATSASTLFLASLASLLAPTSASAAQLVRATESDRVVGIKALEVEGQLYDVQFIFDSFNNIYADGTFDFNSEATARLAYEAIMGELGASDYTGNNYGRPGDGFVIPYSESYSDKYNWVIYEHAHPDADVATKTLYYKVLQDDQTSGRYPYAKFTPATQPASTPEPNLIVGFITLGGLMLGSKRKAKG